MDNEFNDGPIVLDEDGIGPTAQSSAAGNAPTYQMNSGSMSDMKSPGETNTTSPQVTGGGFRRNMKPHAGNKKSNAVPVVKSKPKVSNMILTGDDLDDLDDLMGGLDVGGGGLGGLTNDE